MTTLTARHHSLEADIHRIGREIFHRAEAAAPSILSMEYWQQQAMNWMTRDDDLKLRIFRFIEIMPRLDSTTDIARQLEQHLRPPAAHNGSPPRDLPFPLALALAYRRPDSIYATLVASAARFACGRSARQFIAGATPEEALVSLQRLRRGGMTFTLDVLGETVTDDRIARHHQQLYLDLIERLSPRVAGWTHRPILDDAPWGPLPRVNVSLKLSALVVSFDGDDPQAESEAVLERLRPVLRSARRHRAFINIDMEHYSVKDMTLDIYRRILSEPEFRDWPDCGIVIQCYMPEADADTAALIDWARRRGTPITVRLVKGAYWDSEVAAARRAGRPIPLYTEKWQSDAAFERIGALMLENADIVRPAFASHNVRSIAAVLARQAALNLPERTLELQMLTGMGDALKRALVSMRQRLRVYAPVGDLMSGMAYLIRRLIENTANESFLRQSFGEGMPIDELLAAPGDDHRPQPGTPAHP